MKLMTAPSRVWICFSLIFFMLLASTDVLPARIVLRTGNEKKPVVRVKHTGQTLTPDQKKRFDALLGSAKSLYSEMEYAAAIEKLNEAKALSVTNAQKSDVYFYLSLALFAEIEQRGDEVFHDALRNLIEADYDRQLDESICPSRYLEVHREIKKEYGVIKVRSKPAGADVYVNNDRASSGKTPLTLVAKAGVMALEVRKGKKKKVDELTVVAGEETATPEYELKGKSSLIYVIGGAVAAGGIAVAVLAGGGGGNGGGNGIIESPLGNLQVNSSPEGARIFMNGEDTGISTNYTFAGLNAGTYEVRLELENYVDFAEQVTVSANQTTSVDAGLSLHTLQVAEPQQNSTWEKDEVMEVVWGVGGASSQGSSRPTVFIRNLRANPGRGVGHFRNRSGAVSRSGIAALRTRSTRSLDRGIAVLTTGSSGTQSAVPAATAAAATGRGDLLRSLQLRVQPPDLADHSMPNRSGTAEHSRQNADSLGESAVQLLSRVKIDLYHKGKFLFAIADNVENTGSFSYGVNPGVEEDDRYKIRISSMTNPDVFGESHFFEIIDQSYRFVSMWGSEGSGPGEFQYPMGIAVDGSGFVYVSDYNNERVQKFNGSGSYVDDWDGGSADFEGLVSPLLMSFGPSGRLYVSDPAVAPPSVVIMDTNGNYEGEIHGPPGNYAFFPTGIAFNSAGDIYVADLNNHRIVKFSASGGDSLDEWGSEGLGKYKFRKPYGLAIDGEDNIYVVDRDNHRIVKYDSSFSYLDEWGGAGAEGEDPFKTPRGITIDGEDNVYIADTGGNRVLKFHRDGGCLAKWGSYGSGSDQLYAPVGIAVDSAGNVYVADNGNHRVMKLRRQ